MKQTAVEWLVSEMNKLKMHVDDSEHDKVLDIIEQAKAMEKEQMKLSRVPIAYENKSWQGLIERHFEQWYNETFKSE